VTVSRWEWLHRRRSRLLGAAIAVLLLFILFESFLLFEARTAYHATETQSSKLLTRFLEGDTAQVTGSTGVSIRMQNVRFKWSDKVYIDTDNIAVRAVPVQGNVVNFDDLSSFHLVLQQSSVFIRPDVLEGMFNESVFNYPESKIRDLKVTLTRSDNQRVVLVKGSVNVGIWISFEMKTRLAVDTKTNTLVLDVDHLKVLGLFPVLHLVKIWKPFSLESLISLPPNKSLLVDGTRLMVKPFGLFPPPRVDGKMASVTMDDHGIRLAFAGRPIPAPESSAKNYVFLRGGMSQFGSFRMLDTDILILDQDPSDPFVFSLVHYAGMVPRSKIEVHDTKSARVTMPDF